MTTLKIIRDDSPSSPRDWDNMGTMIAFHNRYSLGDSGHGYRSQDYNSWDEMERAILKDNPGGVILPLYLYDHSGITMNTTGFDCRWDSGQVGFIVASAARIRESYGVKRISAKVRQRVMNSLRGEVELYDQYITGDVYGYVLTHDDGEEDSCWGFFGNDPFTNGMSDHIPDEFHSLLKEAANNA